MDGMTNGLDDYKNWTDTMNKRTLSTSTSMQRVEYKPSLFSFVQQVTKKSSFFMRTTATRSQKQQNRICLQTNIDSRSSLQKLMTLTGLRWHMQLLVFCCLRRICSKFWTAKKDHQHYSRSNHARPSLSSSSIWRWSKAITSWTKSYRILLPTIPNGKSWNTVPIKMK